MAPNVDRDPILEAYHLWNENGWEDCAAGLHRGDLADARSPDDDASGPTRSWRRSTSPSPATSCWSGCTSTQGSLPLNQLGKELQIHQTSITSLVDRLEKQGLIKRTPHPTDRRSTIAQMTPAGRALTGKAINLLNAEFFRDLGLSQREAHLLIGLLMKMRRSWDDIGNPEGWEPFEAAWTPRLANAVGSHGQ